MTLTETGRTLRLTLAAVEALACLTTHITGSAGKKRPGIAEAICAMPLYGFNAPREFPGWTPVEVVDAALEDLAAFLAHPAVLGERSVLSGRDRSYRAEKNREIKGFYLSERAATWAASFLVNLTPEGCQGCKNTVK